MTPKTKRLFGTDGVRGVAGEPPLDPRTVRRLGAALGEVLEDEYGRPCRVVIGRDTRESGLALTGSVAMGLASCGATAIDAGVITTPGLAYLVAHGDFEAAVMVSASHNAFRDNGLKAFGRDGYKLSDALEQRVEALVLDRKHVDPAVNFLTATLGADAGLRERYVRFLESLLPPGRLAGLHIAIDCANGSACTIAPEIFRHYGANVVVLGAEPNGRNINENCGSLHLAELERTVSAGKLDLGLAFDGDADRVLAVDRRARTADGDHILYLTARRLKQQGDLRNSAVVATILSNLWLEQRLGDEGITLHRAGVGDKYVLERMLEEDAVLGGEQSGHVIFRQHSTTGDGILTGLMLIDTLLAEERTLDAILDGITPCPQVQLNVRVREKPDLLRHPRIGPAVLAIERELAGSGRVVLRYSGTEPLARVMVEGLAADQVRRLAENLARMIGEELGG